jgi:hypothetical protein
MREPAQNELLSATLKLNMLSGSWVAERRMLQHPNTQ